MKIAILTKYAAHAGGVESMNALLAKILRELGHTPHVIGGEQIPYLWNNSVTTKILGEPRIHKFYFQDQLRSYDLVVCNGEFGFGIRHPRCINIFHGSFHGYAKALRPYLGFRSALQLRRGAQFQRKSAQGKTVIAVSHFLKNVLEDQGITVDHVFANSVNTEHFTPQNFSKKKECLFVGRYDYLGKGLDVLKRIAETGISIDCVTNHPPPSPLGFIPETLHQKMPDLYNQYRIFLFPSRFEGMPIAPLEAMACGLPSIVSQVGLGEELKKEIPEFVVETFEPKQYVNRVQHINENYEIFSQRAREYVKKHHNYERLKRQWKELIGRGND